MKQFTKIISAFIIIMQLSCSKPNDLVVNEAPFTQTSIDLTTHKISAYSFINNTKYLVVFESGFGDDHTVWYKNEVAQQLTKFTDVVLYDRAGYGKSESNSEPRTIAKLSSELATVIANFAKGRKVILVGHSLGGVIIRDYAIKNPDKTAGLIFVDSSHEMYNHPSQADEDNYYNAVKNTYGINFGGTLEVREFVENFQYTATLPNLPNIPVIAITSMKIDSEHDAKDRELWYNSKEALKKGVTNFVHITTTKSGHYIMWDEPNLILDNIQNLLVNLP